MRRVLVTGSSRGIGRAIAEKLAANGFNVTVHCNSNRQAGEEALAAVRSFSPESGLVQFDVSRGAEVEQILEQDINERGPYWGVVCNAGITSDAPFPAMSREAWESVINTNLGGFYNVLRPLVMPMVSARQRGRIVTISSVAGIAGNRGQVNYSASKAGIIGATKSLAQELAKREITVNCVAPGLIETEMTQKLPVEELKKMIPMRRLGTANEVAGVVAFLFSDDASYLTGQVLSVNGGML